MKKDNALLIFTRNLVFGKVKTRLAATIGHKKAFVVYKLLIDHTFSATRFLPADKYVFYSDYKEAGDVWTEDYFRAAQSGKDLGKRMSNAFNYIFRQGYKKAVIIGADCPDLDETVIQNAFDNLDHYDVVIGPALDGGYYLLGMKSQHSQLFENMAWSTETVFRETIARCEQLQLTYFLLPVLNDVDEEKDLINTSLIKNA